MTNVGPLVGRPVHAEIPADAATAAPVAHGNLPDVPRERGMTLPGRTRSGSDDLDQAGDERQPFAVVRRSGRVGRLALARQVADHRDRADAVVRALDPPRGDGRVVHGAVEGEVEPHVPLQPVRGSGTDARSEERRVGDDVREHVPVAGRRLGAGAVGPELGHEAGEVGSPDDVGGIRRAGGRVEVVAVAVVRAERVVAASARADVDRRRVTRVELGARPDYLDGLLLVRVAVRGAERWLAGVDRQALLRGR